jgi:hypothetical protein
MAKLRDLVGDLPASADHHHSSRFGLLQHSLEVALKMLEEFEKTLLPEAPPDVALFNTEADPLQTQYLYFLAGLGSWQTLGHGCLGRRGALVASKPDLRRVSETSQSGAGAGME